MPFSKIAGLPTIFRSLINKMLDEGRNETEIAEKVTGMLANSERPELADIKISQQNVSGWKGTGYTRWQAQAKAREMAGQIAKVRGDGNKVQDSGVADNIADIVLGELAVMAAELLEEKLSCSERKKRIEWLVPHVAQLRRGSHARSWIRLEALKLEIAINKQAQNLPDHDPSMLGNVGGISEALMEDIRNASGLLPEEGHVYQCFSPEDVERIQNDVEIQLAREQL